MNDVEARYRALLQTIESRVDVPAREASFLRMQAALEACASDLCVEEIKHNVILVAGTNGKGTVAKFLETMLSAAGERVGLFTSPHLIATTERIRTAGGDLSKSEFLEAYEVIRKPAERLKLSHFEILTLMMVEVFFGRRIREPVTAAVLEVGVGGRLDPTRLIAHSTTVITRLGLDHQALLGPTLADIALEKFGAVDDGNLVVHAPFSAEVGAVARKRQTEIASRWVEAEIFPYTVERANDSVPIWQLQTPWAQVKLPLPGARAVENASVAIAVLREMGRNVDRLVPALANARWPGRMELFRVRGRRVYLSGDHNVQGAQTLCEILENFVYRDLLLVVGIGRNKSADEILEMVSRLPVRAPGKLRLFLTATAFRAAPLSRYGTWLERAELSCEDAQETLAQAILRAGPEDLVLVSGSLYLVGELRDCLVRGKFDD